MNKKLAFVGAGVIIAAAVFVVSRNNTQPPAAQTQGSIAVRNVPVGGSVCVNPVSNNSKSPVVMEGVDDALVTELKKVGLNARRATDSQSGNGCDAFVFTEIADLKGRGKKTAELEFRLVMASETAPRYSSAVKGKSGDPLPSMNGVASSFTGSDSKFQVASKNDTSALDRDALVSAFAEQARQLQAAQFAK